MKWLIWAGLGSLVPGLLLRLGTDGGGVLPLDLLGVLLLAVWLGGLVAGYWKTPRNMPWMPWAVAFCVLALGSWAWGSAQLGASGQLSALAKWIRLPMGLAFAGAAQVAFAHNKDAFWRGLFIIIALVLGLGFVQLWVYPDLANISTDGGWDPHIGRLLGTWMDPNFVAGLCAISLPLVFARFYQTKNTWLLGLIVLLLGALLYTFSRSGLLAASCGLMVYFLIRDPKWLLVGVLAGAIGIAANERTAKRLGEFAGTVKSLVLADTDEIDPTANLRIESWTRSLSLWRKYPLVGIGYNTYRDIAAEEGIVQEHFFSAGGSDSTHLTVLVTTGIVGFMLFAAWWARLTWWAFARYFQSKDELALGLGAAVCAICVHALFVNSWLFPFLFFPLMAAAGVIAPAHDE